MSLESTLLALRYYPHTGHHGHGVLYNYGSENTRIIQFIHINGRQKGDKKGPFGVIENT